MNVAEFIGGCQWTRGHLRVVRVLIECEPNITPANRQRMLESLDAAAKELGVNIKQQTGRA